MHRAVERACAASDRHSLVGLSRFLETLVAPQSVVLHQSSGGTLARSVESSHSRIRGGPRRAWNRCDLRWRHGWEAFPVLAPAAIATLCHCHLERNLPIWKKVPSFGFKQFSVTLSPSGGWSSRSGLLILSKFGTLLMAFSNSSFNFGMSSLVMARASATPTFVEPIFVAVPGQPTRYSVRKSSRRRRFERARLPSRAVSL